MVSLRGFTSRRGFTEMEQGELWARKKPHEHVACVLLGGNEEYRLRGQHQAFLNGRSQETAIIAGPSMHIVLPGIGF